MGTWGIQPLDNDDARDWLEIFRERPTKEAIREAFLALTDGEFADATSCSEALAAAQYMAASISPMAENSSISWNETQKLFCGLKKKEKSELRDLAILAVSRVKSDSELRDLWNEQSDRFMFWEVNVNRLLDLLADFGS